MSQEVVMSKEDNIASYIRQLASIEACIEPFKEQAKDLRKDYVEKGWLTKDEIKSAVRAFRLSKAKINMDQLVESHNTLVSKNLISEE
jgi:polyhydroxyalkanoate synthesis regulator phasin